jgi:hypothetical protein
LVRCANAVKKNRKNAEGLEVAEQTEGCWYGKKWSLRSCRPPRLGWAPGNDVCSVVRRDSNVSSQITSSLVAGVATSRCQMYCQDTSRVAVADEAFGAVVVS